MPQLWILAIFTAAGVFGAIVCTIAELVRPARPLRYRDVVLRDAVAFVVYTAAFYPAAGWLDDRVSPHLPALPHWVAAPLPLRVVVYYLCADFGSYVLHRIMHTRAMWRVHKWHHTPKYYYWFAGVRATIPQQFLFNLPYIIALPLIAPAPLWLYIALNCEVILRNDWMHMNVTWRSNWIEWVFVTPRYHAIHHSDNPAHAGNYGALFTFWDRIFGSRIDPDAVTPTTFGTGSDDNPVRVVIGV